MTPMMQTRQLPRRRRRLSLRQGARAIALAVLLSSLAHAAELLSQNFADMTLEQLGNIQVTSVSKRAETLAQKALALDPATTGTTSRGSTN